MEVKMQAVFNLSNLKNSCLITAKNGQPYIAIPLQDNNINQKQKSNGVVGSYLTLDANIDTGANAVWFMQEQEIIGMIKADAVSGMLNLPAVKYLIKEFGCTIERNVE